jgi:site-specific DNA-methyltransferase (adenine-specific)
MKINNVYNLNCLDGMKLLDDEIIDLTVTSPPYDNMRNYKGYSFDFESIAKELYRITKQGGVVVWVVGDQTIQGSETGTSFKQALFFKEIGFKLHDTMIYEKNSASYPAHRKSTRYTQIFEYMFVFCKGNIKTHNLICDKKNKWAGYKDFSGKIKNPVPNFSPRNNIWKYTTSFNDKTDHPAVFPEELAQDHILSWSNKKDLVFDPFMGSGTTAKMAILNDRNWLGFEISKEYCEMTKKRVSGLYPQNDIFDFMKEEE